MEMDLKQSTPDDVFHVPGYRLFGRDRHDGKNKSGGGVAIYLREEKQAELLKQTSSPGTFHLEPL